MKWRWWMWTLAACLGGLVAQADWLGQRLAFLFPSDESVEQSQWLCHDSSTINIAVSVTI